MNAKCFVFILALCLPVSVLAQAMDDTLYVDVEDPVASDENPGTSSLPLRSIQAAMDQAIDNKESYISTLVVIRAGTYREDVSFGGTNYPGQFTPDPDNPTPMRVEAEETGTVIITGSDVWTAWRLLPVCMNKRGLYWHAWDYDWGGDDVLSRREMVFINGELVTQVMSIPELVPGTFHVDDAADRIYLYPPAVTDMLTDTVEVSVRGVLWNQTYENNVTLRGITFEHGAHAKSGGIAATRFVASDTLLIEDSRFLWNSWAGTYMEGDSITVRRSIFNYNGGNGWGTWYVRNLLLEYNETSYNNWRGALGEHYGFDVGNKIESVHGLTVRRHKATGNMSRGLWLDFDIRDAVLDSLLITDNLWDGLWFEANHGPITLTNSKICNNGRTGLLTTYTEDVLVDDNLFYMNASGTWPNLTLNNSGGLEIGGAGTRAVKDFETGQTFYLRAQRWTVTNNTFVGGTFGHPYANGPTLIDTPLGTADWNTFLSTYTSNNNVWWNAVRTQVFGFPQYNDLTFAQWQSQTGQDAASTFADPQLDPSICDNF